jgi:hypothetical protein
MLELALIGCRGGFGALNDRRRHLIPVSGWLRRNTVTIFTHFPIPTTIPCLRGRQINFRTLFGKRSRVTK